MRPVYTHTGESRHLPRTRCSDVARELREDTPPRTLPPSSSAPATLPVCTYNQPSATPMKPARQKKTAARSNRAGRSGGIYLARRATAKFESTPASRHVHRNRYWRPEIRPCRENLSTGPRLCTPIRALSPAGPFLGDLRWSIRRCDSNNDRRRRKTQ